jgi:hypothetical protein
MYSQSCVFTWPKYLRHASVSAALARRTCSSKLAVLFAVWFTVADCAYKIFTSRRPHCAHSRRSCPRSWQLSPMSIFADALSICLRSATAPHYIKPIKICCAYEYLTPWPSAFTYQTRALFFRHWEYAHARAEYDVGGGVGGTRKAWRLLRAARQVGCLPRKATPPGPFAP